MDSWVRHAMFWHVYPLGFLGAEPHALDTGDPPVHRLPTLQAWLDYVIELGLSGLALGPIFSAGSHGYDTHDYFRIDTRLGDEKDFDALLSECRRRGLHVVLDGVFNHVGRGFAPFIEVMEQGPHSPAAEWFQLHWHEGAGPGTMPDYETFEGHEALVALDHGSQRVVDFVVEVMCHWLARGISGWRLDAAYAVPSDFWAEVLPRVRQHYPQAYVVGEVIHGDYADVVASSGMDAVTQYELWKAVWSSLNDINFYELAHALERHTQFLQTFVPQTFLGNHDVTRLATRLHDERHFAHALLVLMTIGGTPTIYAGDEQAMQGTKEEREGGDDAVRPAFPASPAGLADEGWATYVLHQELIALRRRHPWLHEAAAEILTVGNAHLVYGLSGQGERLIVALNISDDEAVLDVPGAQHVVCGPGTLMAPEAQRGADERGEGAAAGSPNGLSHHAVVPAHGWSVLRA